MSAEYPLRERTVFINAPFSSSVQSLMYTFTQFGADVALVDSNTTNITRFCNQLNDHREANDKLGRAFAFQADMKDPAAIQEVVGKVASTFGSIDIYIDGFMSNTPTVVEVGGAMPDLDGLFSVNLKSALATTHHVLNFLKGRKRGRVVYLLNEQCSRGAEADALAAAMRTGLIAYSKAISKQMLAYNVTVNVLSLGYTEEYLSGHYPEASSMKDAQEKIRQTDIHARITDPDKIAQTVVFLTGPSGAAVTGQVIGII